MFTFLVHHFDASSPPLTLTFTHPPSLTHLKQHIQDYHGLPIHTQHLIIAKPVTPAKCVGPWRFTPTFKATHWRCHVRVQLRLAGGKGGFGSLLRSKKSKKNKAPTDRSANRDLQGRRLRHVQAEQAVRDWQLEERPQLHPRQVNKMFRAIKQGKGDLLEECRFGAACRRYREGQCRYRHPGQAVPWEDDERDGKVAKAAKAAKRFGVVTLEDYDSEEDEDYEEDDDDDDDEEEKKPVIRSGDGSALGKSIRAALLTGLRQSKRKQQQQKGGRDRKRKRLDVLVGDSSDSDSNDSSSDDEDAEELVIPQAAPQATPQQS